MNQPYRVLRESGAYWIVDDQGFTPYCELDGASAHTLENRLNAAYASGAQAQEARVKALEEALTAKSEERMLQPLAALGALLHEYDRLWDWQSDEDPDATRECWAEVKAMHANLKALLSQGKL